MACERPDKLGRSLSQWDCRELAEQLVREGVVRSISPDTVRRILENHHLKPWRHHLWLSPKVPRDADFAARVQDISDLYTRPLAPHEMVLSVDEKTSLQPRPRKAPTKPACPRRPVQVEHEYGRCGALNLFAAFDTRTGKVYGHTAERKMERQLIADYEASLDRILSGLNRDRLATAVKIASVPEQIRGFGHVKDASVGPAKAEEKRLWATWEKAGAEARELEPA